MFDVKVDPYKFGSHNSAELIGRGKSTYGSKVDNSVCECPVCFGGKRLGMLVCNNCKGEGVIKNDSEGQEALNHGEDEQCEGDSPVKMKKKMGPYSENKKVRGIDQDISDYIEERYKDGHGSDFYSIGTGVMRKLGISREEAHKIVYKWASS